MVVRPHRLWICARRSRGTWALSLGWTRRSPLGWNFPGDEPPLARVRSGIESWFRDRTPRLQCKAQEPAVLISSDNLGNMTGPVMVTVIQLGDFGESRPLIGTIEI